MREVVATYPRFPIVIEGNIDSLSVETWIFSAKHVFITNQNVLLQERRSRRKDTKLLVKGLPRTLLRRKVVRVRLAKHKAVRGKLFFSRGSYFHLFTKKRETCSYLKQEGLAVGDVMEVFPFTFFFSFSLSFYIFYYLGKFQLRKYFYLREEKIWFRIFICSFKSLNYVIFSCKSIS